MLKTLVQRQLRRFGYEIHKRGESALYHARPPFPHSTYSPWFDQPFASEFDAVRDRSSLSEDRAYVLRQLAAHCTHVAGDFAEAGVYRGGTAKLMASVMTPTGGGRRLHLFDTFAGMREAADGDPSGHGRGDFADTSEAAVREYLRAFPFVDLHVGYIPRTFAGLHADRFAFVHVDVDLYQAGLDCCEFFYPRMSRGGFMLFDDYGFPKYEQTIRAGVNQFFRSRPESVVALPTGQCFVAKL